MYNNKLICTYIFYNKSLFEYNPISLNYIKERNIDNDDIPDSDLQSFSDLLYRNELIEAFLLNDFDETLINTKITELYNLINLELTDNHFKKEFKETLTILSSKFFSDDLFLGFISLFSYQLFHITHLCISDFLLTKTFNQNNIDFLKKNINLFF